MTVPEERDKLWGKTIDREQRIVTGSLYDRVSRALTIKA